MQVRFCSVVILLAKIAIYKLQGSNPIIINLSADDLCFFTTPTH